MAATILSFSGGGIGNGDGFGFTFQDWPSNLQVTGDFNTTPEPASWLLFVSVALMLIIRSAFRLVRDH